MIHCSNLEIEDDVQYTSFEKLEEIVNIKSLGYYELLKYELINQEQPEDTTIKTDTLCYIYPKKLTPKGIIIQRVYVNMFSTEKNQIENNRIEEKFVNIDAFDEENKNDSLLLCCNFGKYSDTASPVLTLKHTTKEDYFKRIKEIVEE